MSAAQFTELRLVDQVVCQQLGLEELFLDQKIFFLATQAKGAVSRPGDLVAQVQETVELKGNLSAGQFKRTGAGRLGYLPAAQSRGTIN